VKQNRAMLASLGLNTMNLVCYMASGQRALKILPPVVEKASKLATTLLLPKKQGYIITKASLWTISKS
jgi:hypothetical protein